LEENPSYYAIIESKIRYDNDLKPNEKLLYAEVTALCNKEGYCWATNNYFADLFDVTPQTVSSWVSRLVDKGYLDREIIRDEKKRVKKRKLYIGNLFKKNLNRYKENKGEGIKKNLKGNTTRFNTTSNNKDREEVPYKKIADLYNSIAEKLPNIRKVNDQRKRHLKARWNEEGNIDVFEEVFTIAENTPFLTGDNDRNWTADFDWLIKNNSNFNKVLEGKYGNCNSNEEELLNTVDYSEVEEYVNSQGGY